MRFVAAILAGLLLVAGLAVFLWTSQTVEQQTVVEEPDTAEADIEAIHALREAWVAADIASDLDGVMAVFTDDVVIMVAEVPTLIGKEAVRSWYPLGYGGEYEMSSDEVVVAGGWAFDQGTFTSDGEAGRYLGILQRQTDGSWKYARVMGIDDPPPEQ